MLIVLAILDSWFIHLVIDDAKVLSLLEPVNKNQTIAQGSSQKHFGTLYNRIQGTINNTGLVPVSLDIDGVVHIGNGAEAFTFYVAIRGCTDISPLVCQVIGVLSNVQLLRGVHRTILLLVFQSMY
jgi:hypothetical protein